MAGLVIPTSGPYVAVFNSLALGTQGDDGFRLSCTVQGQEINASDAYGMTLVEAIYRGQNWRLGLNGLEWFQQGLLNAHQMFGSVGPTTTTIKPILANVGDRWTTYCKTLLLAAILNNTVTIPQTITAANAGLSPNSQAAYNLTSKMREMPLEFVLIPYSTTISSVVYNVPFTTT